MLVGGIVEAALNIALPLVNPTPIHGYHLPRMLALPLPQTYQELSLHCTAFMRLAVQGIGSEHSEEVDQALCCRGLQHHRL